MFVLSHAWRSVIRNKGRNVLIIIVAAVIAASATIGLSIRQAADAARSSGLSHTSVTAQISLDRSKLFNAMRSSGNNTGTPDFKSLRASIAGKELTLADYEKYGKASSTLTGAYYTQTAAVAKTTNFQPVSSTDTSSSSSSSSSSDSSSSSSPQGEARNSTSTGRTQEGEMGGGMRDNGDFKLIGFSSDTAVKNAPNGTFTMSAGKVFDYAAADTGKVIVSKSLADFDNLSVGSTISVANASDSSTTYPLTVVGIYQNGDASLSGSGPSFSTAADPANAIYTSVATMNALGLSSSNGSTNSGTTGDTQLSYSYVFANKAGYETFVKQAKQAGLSSDYTVSSADVEAYDSSLIPLNNLSTFALTLLLIVLGVGALVLVVLNVFNIRERKYEVGVLTAIGVNKITVAAQFVVELFIVTLIGLAIGTGIGAATSVPISNQLLANQVAAQTSERSIQEQQFGRGFQQRDPGQSGATGSNGGTASGGGTAPSITGNRSTGRRGSLFSGANSPLTRTTSYIATVNSTVNLTVLGELILIAIGLAALSSLVAVIFVMRYEPLQILADRS